MIFKVQVAIASTGIAPPALIYDRSRQYEGFMSVTQEMKKAFEGLPFPECNKGFFNGRVAKDEVFIDFTKRLPDQGW